MCEERIRLSDAVAKAVQAVYTAKANQDRANREKKDVAPFTELLAQARSAEAAAVRALDEHRKQHQC
jgi:hypothetical protein